MATSDIYPPCITANGTPSVPVPAIEELEELMTLNYKFMLVYFHKINPKWVPEVIRSIMVAGDVIQMAASMDCLKIHFNPNDVGTKHFFMPKVSG